MRLERLGEPSFRGLLSPCRLPKPQCMLSRETQDPPAVSLFMGVRWRINYEGQIKTAL
jgi:hypothetical protein